MPTCRVVKTNAEQLGVILMLAARGYDEVVTVGVDRRTAIAPVAEKYPRVRFVAAKGDLAEWPPGARDPADRASQEAPTAYL